MIEIRPGDLDDPRIVALLTLHATTARDQTVAGSAHALDPDALRAPGIALWSVWDGDALRGVGALKRLSARTGEIKSMHTIAAARRTGAGSLLLRHLIAQAAAAGLDRLYLETGSWPYFAPARAFYRAHGFTDCVAFGDYRADPNSVFMTLGLEPRSIE